MTKVLDPLHSGEARGRMGGLVYNTSRGNRYVKQFTSPTLRRTVAQMLVRSCLSTCSRAWQLLTPARMTAWYAWAAAHPRVDWTGSSVSWTGHNAYVALNSLLLKHSIAAAPDPPSIVGPASPTAFAAANGILSSSCSWSPAFGAGVSLEFYILAPHSPGAVAKIEKASYKSYQPGETSPYVVTPLPVGHCTIFCRAMNEADGQVSPWVADTAEITAA